MFKLYFGNHIALISTLLLGLIIGYLIYEYLNRAIFQRWGMIILIVILLHVVFWYFANIRDLYSDSIVYATDGSVEMGLFSVGSIQSIVFWIASVAIWLLGIISFFKPQFRQNIFYIISVIVILQILFIEASRIWLYCSIPSRFDYM